jgi:alpha-L-rhamnosidase
MARSARPPVTAACRKQNAPSPESLVLEHANPMTDPILEFFDCLCEGEHSPLAIANPTPRLSWKVRNARKGDYQKAYQVQAVFPALHAFDFHSPSWDSDRVDSSQSLWVPWGANPLPPKTTCHWRVRIWNADNEISGWSGVQTFQTGLYERKQWSGEWIGDQEDVPVPFSFYDYSPKSGYQSVGATAPDVSKWFQVDLLGKESFEEVVRVPASLDGHVDFGFPERFIIEAADDEHFRGERRLIADCHATDDPRPAGKEQRFPVRGVSGRYVRVTVTRQVANPTRPGEFVIAMRELQVMSKGKDLARLKPVQVVDSQDFAWLARHLTDWEPAEVIEARVRQLRENTGSDPAYAALYLQKTIPCPKDVARASVWLCGLGLHELYVNGHRVGDAQLAPPFTNYDQSVVYNAYDITGYLQPGDNAIGVILGNGWFASSSPDLTGSERAPWRKAPRMLLEGLIETSDGRQTTFTSDPSWKVARGPITYSGPRGGEDYDARRELPEWGHPNRDSSHWLPAKSVAAPKGTLRAMRGYPLKKAGELAPTSILPGPDGSWLVRFARPISGWTKIRLRGERGKTVTLTHDGVPTHAIGRYQVNRFTLGDSGEQEFETRFSHFGFNELRIDGLEAMPDPADIRAVEVYNSMRQTGTFHSSDDRLQRIFNSLLQTHCSYCLDHPLDPLREKMGWTQDVQNMMQTALYLTDSGPMYRKWFLDFIEAQDERGFIPPVVPTAGWGYDGSFNCPWWGGCVVLLPWWHYLHCGDPQILAEGYDAMKRYVGYLETIAEDGVIRWGLGDWMEIGSVNVTVGFPTRTPVPLTSTLAYSAYCRILSETAKILGHTADVQRFAQLGESVARTFHETFWNEAAESYAADSQTAHAMVLYFDLVPETLREKALLRLLENIEQHGNHLSTGFIGTLFLLLQLSRSGRSDVATKIVSRPDYPGWLHVLDTLGFPLLMENWRGDLVFMPSCMGPVGAWFFEGLAGIRPDPSGAGFSHFLIAPGLNSGIDELNVSYEGPYGRIAVGWTTSNDQLELAFEVPFNTTATLRLEDSGWKAADSAPTPLDASAPGEIELLSGCHRFTTTRSAKGGIGST